MAYFECIIGSGSATAIPLIVTCSSGFAGTTITASKTGARTQTQTCPSSSPYEVTFILPEDGTWTISGVVSGQTFSETVTILPYEANLNDIPDGSTVTPTDDIQIWLHCANIWNKNYTTVSQVLSDASTLQALIASNNAADYMARSTTWASDVTANQSAMAYIGLNNYCTDILLSDSTWLNAICNSTFFESVLNVKVPTMTSATAPSGVVSTSAQSTSYPAWRSFDGNDSTGWATGLYTKPQWIQYQFTSAIKLKKVKFSFGSAANSCTYQINASNDGSSFQTLKTDSLTGTNSQTYNVAINQNNEYEYLRLTLTEQSVTNGTIGQIMTLQFYGRKDV